MCGLVGLINRDGRPVERQVLADMARAIEHRGPDGEGEFVDGALGFAHKRLAIIDLVTGGQPMTVGPLTIVFNGEIYNYIELRAELVRRGHTFRTKSDTEVIIAMYAAYGPDCVKSLNGCVGDPNTYKAFSGLTASISAVC